MFTLTVPSTLEKTLQGELENLLHPKAYYSVSNRQDPVAVRGTRARREDYSMWQEELPEDDADFRLVLARMRKATGLGDGAITSAIFAHRRLRQLPKLMAVQEHHFHLDLNRLKAIDGVLNKIDDSVVEHMEIIDEEITTFLTPTKANQNLPTAHQISKHLNAIIQTFDTSVSTEDDPLPDPKDHLEVGFDGDRAYLNLEVDGVSGLEIDERVRKYAAAHNVSQVEALKALIRGEGATNITLNIYRAYDIPNAPGWMSGVGYINPSMTDDLVRRASKIQDMDELYDKMHAGYATPDDIRAVVIGWDGTCCEAGCDTPGHRTQMEHRIPHDQGGPTTAANLAAFDQTHHNVKSDGRMIYIIDPVTREKYLLYEDGHWVLSEPSGPLAHKQRRWLQTVGQRMTNHKSHAREKSQERRQFEDRVDHIASPPEDDPPPPF
ncbi:MAG: HNH endonuclease signature motif containing protein [Corynebacterium sp.]|uniref:HNH endonuclease signature motif containing protein n=1 Tax=Corynebacterium sp. TaxID=1720 RepID=UPI0026DEEC0A|nr:HNH endonuclease signature motif containing protein [Corynebacterium sp.]MDO5668722.1 HNH endonuclease signature motif containing protein [Corynebacterium sp.]